MEVMTLFISHDSSWIHALEQKKLISIKKRKEWMIVTLTVTYAPHFYLWVAFINFFFSWDIKIEFYKKLFKFIAFLALWGLNLGE